MYKYDFVRILRKYNMPDNIMVEFETYDNLKKIEWTFEKGTDKFASTELQNAISYDTEASNGFKLPNGDVVGFDIDRYISDESYANMIDNAEPQSLTYLWQVAIGSSDNNIYVFLGQSYDTFKKFIDAFAREIRRAEIYGGKGTEALSCEYDIAESTKRNIKAYLFVHNLGYDFHTHILNCYEDKFLSKPKGKTKRVFAKTSYSPMKADFNVDGIKIELKDTFCLTHKSLRNWSRDSNLKIKKLDESMLPDDFYLQVRVPYMTKLEDYELIYSINDVVCMIYGIEEIRDEWGSIKKMPLTETGYTRRDLRNAVCTQNKEWSEKCVNIMKSYSFEEYNRLLSLFAGGWTHVNAIHSGKIWRKADFLNRYTEFYSYDISSSYPASLCLYRYPTSKFEPVDTDLFDMYAGENPIDSAHKWYARLKCTNVVSKLYNSFWSLSKTETHVFPDDPIEKAECVDNGKIHSMKEMEIYINDVDWETFEKAYDMQYEVLELYVADADYLPVEFVTRVLTYYHQKQMLKGDDSRISEYKAQKRANNACYGISAQRLANDEVDLINIDGTLKWETKHADGDGNVEAAQIFYNQIEQLSPDSTFLMYQIAPYVTAYSRRRLFRAIFTFDEDVWYCDTDSVKVTNNNAPKWFEEENKRVEDRCNQVAAELGIDPNLYNPINPRKPDKNLRLGIWDKEDYIDEFVAYRAKCYCYRTVDKEGKHVHVTLAGLPAEAGVKHIVKKDLDGVVEDVVHGKIETVDDFKLGLVWNEKESFKSTSYYSSTQSEGTWIDREGNKFNPVNEFGFYPKYGICIKPTTFKLSRGTDYMDFLEVMEAGRVYGELNDILKFSYI